MTDEEKIDALAMKVMGWQHPWAKDYSRQFTDAWADSNGEIVAGGYMKAWNPLVNWNDAAMVIGKMTDRFYWTIKSPFAEGEYWYAGLTQLGCSGWNGRPDYLVRHADPLEAIALAALMGQMGAERGYELPPVGDEEKWLIAALRACGVECGE